MRLVSGWPINSSRAIAEDVLGGAVHVQDHARSRRSRRSRRAPCRRSRADAPRCAGAPPRPACAARASRAAPRPPTRGRSGARPRSRASETKKISTAATSSSLSTGTAMPAAEAELARQRRAQKTGVRRDVAHPDRASRLPGMAGQADAERGPELPACPQRSACSSGDDVPGRPRAPARCPFAPRPRPAPSRWPRRSCAGSCAMAWSTDSALPIASASSRASVSSLSSRSRSVLLSGPVMVTARFPC